MLEGGGEGLDVPPPSAQGEGGLDPAPGAHRHADGLGGRLDGHDVHDAAPAGGGGQGAGHLVGPSRPAAPAADAEGAVRQVGARRRGVERDVEGVIAQRGGGQVPPFDEGDGALLHQLGQGQLHHLTDGAGAVDVGVDQGLDGSGTVAAVLADQGEGGTGDRALDTEGGGKALGEGRLARAEVPDEEDGVARRAHPGQAGRHLLGPRRRFGLDDDGPPHQALMSRLARTRSARISARASPPARRTKAGWYVGTRCPVRNG